MNFLSENHEIRFNELLSRSQRKDNEHQALFYILPAFEDTYKAADSVYSFTDECIRPTCTKRIELDCDSHIELIKLGFNLYNPVNKCNLCEILNFCGKVERIVVAEAIRIRYEIK